MLKTTDVQAGTIHNTPKSRDRSPNVSSDSVILSQIVVNNQTSSEEHAELVKLATKKVKKVTVPKSKLRSKLKREELIRYAAEWVLANTVGNNTLERIAAERVSVNTVDVTGST